MEKETGEQSPEQQLDPRVQKVLNMIAFHFGSFQFHKRTGTLCFEVKFDEGELPEGGFTQELNEKVL